MSAPGVSLRDSADGIAPVALCLTGAEVVTKFSDYIGRCASEFTSSYDDRQDLAGEIRLALLSYPKGVSYPSQFVRTVARNLAINRYAYGSRAWEVTETEICELSVDDSSVPFVEYMRSRESLANDPSLSIEMRDTLLQVEKRLSPSEKHCYQLLKQGFEQEDIPQFLGISKQAVSKIIHSIRRKYLRVEREEN